MFFLYSLAPYQDNREKNFERVFTHSVKINKQASYDKEH